MRHSQAFAADCLRCIKCCGMNLTPTTITMIICLINSKGAFAIKLAQASNIHPIIAVAGRGQSYVETLITRSKGDTIIDYRSGDKAVVSGIKNVLEKDGVAGTEVKYAFDAVSEHNSYQNLSEILSTGSKISLLLPDKDFDEIPDHVAKIKTMVGIVHMDVSSPAFLGVAGLAGGKDFGFIFSRLFSRGLQEGWFTGHPYEVIPGGLNGVEQGLRNYKAGVNSATKYIFKIEDTM
jgi:NADPH2:quinone reductase